MLPRRVGGQIVAFRGSGLSRREIRDDARSRCNRDATRGHGKPRLRFVIETGREAALLASVATSTSNDSLSKGRERVRERESVS